MIGSVRIKVHRTITGVMKTCTIIKDVDRWYACITVVTEVEGEVSTECRAPVGVDVGVSPAIALSDGMIIAAPKLLKYSAAEIKFLQRTLARKREGSRNREKARIRLAKAWRKVRNRRDDFVHKQSRYLADNYGIIVFEDLKITNLLKNHSLASAILDACWGKLRRLTAYKAERRGGREILVVPSGTSQECSECGKTVPKELTQRVHRCHYCELVLERNVNAARVILARGLERAHAEAEPLPIIRTGMLGRGSKKPENESFG
jgi:putative transposase